MHEYVKMVLLEFALHEMYIFSTVETRVELLEEFVFFFLSALIELDHLFLSSSSRSPTKPA